MKKFCQYIIENVRYIVTIAGMISIVGGAAWAIAEWKSHQERQVDEVKTEVKQVRNSINSMSYNDSIIINEIRSTKTTVEYIRSVMEKQTAVINALDASYRKHLEQDKKYDVLIQYMNSIDEQLKKNLKGTVFLEKNLLIQQELK